MVRMSPSLSEVVAIRDTAKQLFCSELGTLYRALSAEATTAYGLSPVFVVHDELGQVRGPRSELYDALETAQGAHEDPLSIIISTQAPTDADLLSVLIDDAETRQDPNTVVFMFAAAPEDDPWDQRTWKKANPALDDFRSLQDIDYGSWVKGLTTPRIHAIANTYLKRLLSEAFHHRFDQNIPETLNSSHNLLIVASRFNPSSRRIVAYLAETHGVSINTAFFSYFHDAGNEFLASEFLLDREQVVGRSEAKTKASWTGYYYVNVGGRGRNWEDMRDHGFVSAGGGCVYSLPLDRLSPKDPDICL
jgi:hypothetical protein